ncbi:MAG: lytic transglycosylase domain-containing protein [Anaerolineae bacterium]|nr:lytic transglycosylase domain-containing protein [Anaerolineae bacterium]
MRKIPASEQPTQLVPMGVTVREVAAATLQPRKKITLAWLGAFGVAVFVCLAVRAGLLAGARTLYFSLNEDHRVIYEVVERKEPVTLASTTGEVVSKVPLSPVFTPEVQFWKPLIAEWALAWEIDPNLIATVIQIESCGDPTVSSNAGAQGLFQVMPFHFDAGEDMLNIQNNAKRGLAYLSGGLDASQGNAGLALAGYNGGHSVINKGYGAWHSETRRYYYWGAGIYEDAISGALTSDRLQEWLTAGGQGLCDRASNSQQNLQIDMVMDD